MEENLLWWQRGVIYQIYPRSFMDSNGDGIGDLRGVISKLGYLKWLGVDALWLTPINPSPMKDFGYDISNYCDVHPLFGSMKDFDELLSEVHQMGLKLILDFVPNHTSSEHSWFIESRQSKMNAKKDWYIWKDPSKEGGPPKAGRTGVAFIVFFLFLIIVGLYTPSLGRLALIRSAGKE